MTRDGLEGRGLLQSHEEWATRTHNLGDTLAELVRAYVQPTASRGLDVGCQEGAVTDILARRTALKWQGIDPNIEQRAFSPDGLELRHGWAHEIPFPDAQFDCVLLANVYEHIPPSLYTASLQEMWRVLAKGGILVGQLPNPHFPIESHSRLPFMGWLPYGMQKIYFRLSPVPWAHDFYVVTMKELRRRAEAVGYGTTFIRNFNYPLEVIPQSVRWAARLLDRPMQAVPWAWQFVFTKCS